MSAYNSKHGSFFVKREENTYQKGRSHMQIYRVVPTTKKTEFLTFSLGRKIALDSLLNT